MHLKKANVRGFWASSKASKQSRDATRSWRLRHFVSDVRRKDELQSSRKEADGSDEVLYFNTESIFYEIVKRNIKQLLEAGLIDFYAKYFFEPYEQFVEPKDDAQVLTLKELEGGFVVICVSLLICVIVFCLEWIFKLKDLILKSAILKSYFPAKFEWIEIFKKKKRTSFQTGG